MRQKRAHTLLKRFEIYTFYFQLFRTRISIQDKTKLLYLHLLLQEEFGIYCENNRNAMRRTKKHNSGNEAQSDGPTGTGGSDPATH